MSKIFRLNLSDLLAGMVVAVLGSSISMVCHALDSNVDMNWQGVLYAGLSAGLAYLSKSLVTNSTGSLLTKEN